MDFILLTIHNSTWIISSAPGGSLLVPPIKCTCSSQALLYKLKTIQMLFMCTMETVRHREVLGVFYGSDPHSIYSSSNSLLVIFKSDSNSSYTGFQAVYHAINCSGKLPYAVFFGYNFTRSSNVYCMSVIFSNRVLKSQGLNKRILKLTLSRNKILIT